MRAAPSSPARCSSAGSQVDPAGGLNMHEHAPTGLAWGSYPCWGLPRDHRSLCLAIPASSWSSWHASPGLVGDGSHRGERGRGEVGSGLLLSTTCTVSLSYFCTDTPFSGEEHTEDRQTRVFTSSSFQSFTQHSK